MARWEYNNNWQASLAGRPETVAAGQRIAQQIQANARAAAPRDSGAYAASIQIERADTDWRPRFRVRAADPKARIIESRLGILTRAAQAAAQGPRSFVGLPRGVKR
ncbi:MAG: hypothetical protein LBK42_13780 [Propionibacteriaceae bacterium]|jgi:hypothetical protein|nr:hypothetical protein [Propionibacteriaceae bacterium]